jgi:hypothetical protein
MRHAQFGAAIHREAGRLLAVAQGGVEDAHAVRAYVCFAGAGVLIGGFHGGSAVCASLEA